MYRKKTYWNQKFQTVQVYGEQCKLKVYYWKFRMKNYTNSMTWWWTVRINSMLLARLDTNSIRCSKTIFSGACYTLSYVTFSYELQIICRLLGCLSNFKIYLFTNFQPKIRYTRKIACILANIICCNFWIAFCTVRILTISFCRKLGLTKRLLCHTLDFETLKMVCNSPYNSKYIGCGTVSKKDKFLQLSHSWINISKLLNF